MRILMVSSEVVPFAKVGGLADVVASLSKKLKILGHDVRVVMPRYYSINKEELLQHPAPLGVPVGFGEIWNGVYEGRLPNSDLPIYFLDNEDLYGRDGVYGEFGNSYQDNCIRFTNLSRGALQLCKYLGWYPDVIHAHDWPTAIVPLFLNTWDKDGYFTKTASVLTIHNLGHQGWFPKEDIHNLQLNWDEFFISGLEKFDSINFLKAGIENADIITTVSPTYAQEILGHTFGEGLEGVLASRRGDLYGILNGVDYDEWNPETDSFIPFNYSVKDLKGKSLVKRALQESLGLEISEEKPLIGIVSRFAEQKGFGALCGPGFGSLFSICNDMDVQVVILGTGEKWCEDELKSLDWKLPNLRVMVAFNNEMAHWIEAASDFFLMPSMYEPCGLNQIYSLKYGTLPIVRRTGGLADTVESYDETTGNGTGFVFDDLTPSAIYNVVGWAVWAWYNKPDDIKKMIKSAMKKSFDWDLSVREYEKIYYEAFNKRGVFRGLI